MPMNSDELAAAINLTPDNIHQLIAQGMLAPELDVWYANDTWLSACIAAILDAPDWLQRQTKDDAQIPALIADHQSNQAGAVFAAQAAAAAATEAWRRGAADACMELARRAAQKWSEIEGLAYQAPAAPPRPLARFATAFRPSESCTTCEHGHPSRIWCCWPTRAPRTTGRRSQLAGPHRRSRSRHGAARQLGQGL